MSMQLLSFIVFIFMGLHYAASQSLTDYEAQGACVAMPDGSQVCPTDYTCFAGQCYLSTLPCLTVSGTVICPTGMVCIGAATTAGNACIVLQSSQVITTTVPSNTGSSTPFPFPWPPGPPGPPWFPGPPGPPWFPGPPGPPGPPRPPRPPRPCGHHGHSNCHHTGHH